MSKAKRKGKIFIDWLRNQRGSTAIMPYSARARKGAPVATPTGWDALADIDSPGHWTIADADDLLDRAARDRKSVVEGKRVSVSVDLGCRPIIEKTKNQKHITRR